MQGLHALFFMVCVAVDDFLAQSRHDARMAPGDARGNVVPNTCRRLHVHVVSTIPEQILWGGSDTERSNRGPVFFGYPITAVTAKKYIELLQAPRVGYW